MHEYVGIIALRGFVGAVDYGEKSSDHYCYHGGGSGNIFAATSLYVEYRVYL